MNDLKNDPSGGTLWWAKEADPWQNKYKSFLNLTTGAPCRRPLQRYLISAVYSGCLIKMSQYFNLDILASPPPSRNIFIFLNKGGHSRSEQLW